MGLALRIAILAASAIGVACHGLTAHADTPAVRESPTADGQAEIEAVLRRALGDRQILLSSDVLTQSSLLMLERSVRRDVQGGNPLGRDLGQPERFQLLLSDGHCYLLRQATGERWPMTLRCVPESN